MKKLTWWTEFVLVSMLVILSLVSYAETEEPKGSNVWGLYTKETVGIWRPCFSEEILKMSDDNILTLQVINLKANEGIVWSWKCGFDDVVHQEPIGESVFSVEVHYKPINGWSVLTIWIVTEDGAYHPLGEYPISFGTKGDYVLKNCVFNSFGSGTLVVSLPTVADVRIVSRDGTTKLEMLGVPPVDLEFREVELGDKIRIIGRDGEKRSLPRYYQVTEDDF